MLIITALYLNASRRLCSTKIDTFCLPVSVVGLPVFASLRFIRLAAVKFINKELQITKERSREHLKNLTGQKYVF